MRELKCAQCGSRAMPKVGIVPGPRPAVVMMQAACPDCGACGEPVTMGEQATQDYQRALANARKRVDSGGPINA